MMDNGISTTVEGPGRFPLTICNNDIVKQSCDELGGISLINMRRKNTAGLLILPKKDGTLRVVQDMRGLNERLKKGGYLIHFLG